MHLSENKGSMKQGKKQKILKLISGEKMLASKVSLKSRYYVCISEHKPGVPEAVNWVTCL